jgi:hypothetical protein
MSPGAAAAGVDAIAAEAGYLSACSMTMGRSFICRQDKRGRR